MPTTPPHLAELEVAYARPDQGEDFLATAVRAFHHDYQAERFTGFLGVLETERAFGYVVDGRWVSTCGAFSRVMAVPGGTVPVAAVSLVTVSQPYRRRGLLRQMMHQQLADVARRNEPVALLWASESGIYGRFGYGVASHSARLSGPTRRLDFRPELGPFPGSVALVDQEEFLDAAVPLHQTWLPHRPGALARTPTWWQMVLHDPESDRSGSSAHRFALHFDASGRADGYLVYRTKEDASPAGSNLEVLAADAAEPSAYAALWRFVLDFDLIATFSRPDTPTDDPLRLLVADPRQIRTEIVDSTYLRIVDLPAALAARTYPVELEATLAVSDPVLRANDGVFRLRVGGDGAEVTAAAGAPDLSLDIRELGAVYLGGTPFTSLVAAGLVTEHTPGTAAALTAAFSAPRAPFCPDFF